MAADLDHTLRPTSKTSERFDEAFSNPVDQNFPEEIGSNCDEGFELEHAPMMALSPRDVKQGKPGSLAHDGEPAKFSRLFRL